MAKSKGRLLAELLASDGKVKESKSALDISGGKLAPSDIPILPNSKLENSSISIAGHSTSLGESVSLNTGDITEHTNYKYYTDTRVRSAISATGDIAYNSTTGVISFSQAAGAVVSVNGTTGSVVLDTGDIAENGNLYHTTSRARAAISATGSLSYNSTTGVISFTMPAQNTSNITEGSNLYYTNARADARIVNAGSANWNTAYTVANAALPKAGGTLTGDLVVEDSEIHVGDISGDSWTRIKHAQADGYGFDFIHDNATVLVNEQGSTNEALVLGDVDANNNYSGLFGVSHSANSGVSWTKKLDLRGDGDLYVGSSAQNKVWHEGTLTTTNKSNYDTAYTYSQVGHLNLTGGTLTGGLSGTTGSFSGTLQATGGVSVVGTLGTWSIDNQGAVLNFSRASNNYVRAGSTGGALRFDTDGNNAALLLDTNQNATFYGSVSSTYFRVGTTTVIDSSRNITANHTYKFSYNDYKLAAGTGSVAIKNNSNAVIANFTTGAHTLNGTLTVNSAVSGITDIDFGKAIAGHNTSSPARITAGSGGKLYIDSTQNQHIYLGWYNGSGFDVISEMNARFASYKDRSDTAYFVNPAGASNIRNLAIKGTTNDSSTDALVVRDSLNATLLRVRNDGVVMIDDNYLYVTASQGAYFSGSIKARGGIYNDQADLLLNDNVEVSGYTNMTGQLSFTANNTAIRMRDSAGAYTRTMILNGSNVMYIGPVDAYAGGSILYGASSNVSGQTFYVGGNARLAVTGSGITVTGTITGDITGSLSGTATQASNLNNHNTGNLSEGSNLYYTNARVGSYLSSNGYDTSSNIIAAITDSAPVLLDTLNELANAIGDDENFSTTITDSIALKAPLASPSLTGNTSIAGNLMMTSGTSHIELGSYLKLYGATGSNTGAIAVNANYDGGGTNTWTPDYSGVSGAGMFVLRQIGGGYGTMQVYQKKHGTTGGSHAISTFTKTAEFNDDGYFYGRNLRSERYYSSDNTAYYTDPSETSVIKQILINGASNNSGKADFAVGAGGDPQVSWNSNQVQIGGTDMNWNGKIHYGSNIFNMAAWDANIEFFSQGGSTSRNIVFSPSNAGTLTERLTIHGDNGAVIASSQIRAPIYYDHVNTSFYTDPAGTSKMSAIQLGADASPTLTGDGSQLKIQTTGGYVAIGPDNSSWMHFSTDRNSFYFNKKITVNQGIVDSYDEDLQLRRAASTTARLRITSGTTISDQPLTVTGNVQHQGLTMTSGTDIDQIYTVTDALTLSTSWQNTSINSTELATGTYIVQVYVSDFAVGGGHYYEMYSGIMSWYGSGTNSTAVDELPLHRAGHAPNTGDFYMRTARNNSGGNNLTVQVRGTTSNSGASNYTFKFRRMI